MFNKTSEVKVLRDPIHGYIHIEYQVIWDCLNTKEFQRLRRIHQLGGDFQVYHTAEHSRFSHSLGVYEITRRMVMEVSSISDSLSEEEKVQAMCAGLLHDLGHGPFSHFFESIQKISHEQRTIELIKDPNTEIHQVLVKEDIDLPNRIQEILEHRHSNEILNQIISSQLDADRMDYLLRDAYETGTSYGTFDLERMLRTLRVKNGKLCIKESGMHSVEDYIMARYHMYWQVYLHPDAKSYEILIEYFFKRYREIHASIQSIPCLEPLLKDTLTNKEFYYMDEYRMMVGFQEALSSKDEILRNLATSILDRHLFEWIENPDDDQIQDIKNQCDNLEYDYYEDVKALNTYLPYQENKSIIWILNSKNELKPLSDCSEIVKALLKMENHPKRRIYFKK